MANSPPPLFKQGPPAFVRLLFFVLLSFLLLIIDVRYKTLEVVRSVISTAIYPFQQVALAPQQIYANISAYLKTNKTLKQENTWLQKQNLVFSFNANRAAQLQQENTELRGILKLAREINVKSTPAMISYVANDPFVEKVVINKGSHDEIAPGLAVVNENGLIGQVSRVFPFQSEVTLLTDRHSAVYVQVLRNGLRGIVYGTSQGDALSLNFVPVNADIKEGDVLMTSGLDGVYPPGIPVAWVVALDRKSDITFAKILCLPIASIKSANDFLVLHYQHSMNPNPLLASPDLPRKLRKVK